MTVARDARPVHRRPPCRSRRSDRADPRQASTRRPDRRVMFVLYAIPIGVLVGLSPRRPARSTRRASPSLGPAHPPRTRGAGCASSPKPAGGSSVDRARRCTSLRRLPSSWRSCAISASRAWPSSRSAPGCNLAAIVANGGWMPADAGGARLGRRARAGLHEQHRGREPAASAADRPVRPAGVAAVRQRVQRRRRADRGRRRDDDRSGDAGRRQTELDPAVP